MVQAKDRAEKHEGTTYMIMKGLVLCVESVFECTQTPYFLNGFFSPPPFPSARAHTHTPIHPHTRLQTHGT